MRYKAPGRCPICGQELTVSRLSCQQCNTNLEGQFSPCRFCQLPADQIEFVEVFIKCRGNIKEVEKEMGISYPTVRNRLEGVIQALGFQNDQPDKKEREDLRTEILDALERGEIDPREAVEQLKKLKR
ncbi:MAG TPA: DUF2089 domain-containing protein [Syntrophomonadaceae bacterium]|nr:DUF2089 domain-containing protein [Syntrophomonadaceae bacterium]